MSIEIIPFISPSEMKHMHQELSICLDSWWWFLQEKHIGIIRHLKKIPQKCFSNKKIQNQTEVI